ncbi:FecR family protein [Phenylobacterium soli]|uniref:Iron dicitrate transport regulator FecR n=1 Tax=Phenylobacterium soli TaxID=2170551 RepID=A0A328AKC6_9CAUL|nr:FecR domain-containing protein [Phenylobacterium soli]RAK54845.1 iron dicitrate transport regulator FecR [Phenylobacterium soli]
MARETLYEEAADWLVRLQSEDLDEADLLAFDAWLATAPANAAAYDAALRVSNEYGSNAQAVRKALGERRVRPARLQQRGRFYAAAGAVAAAVAVAVVVVPAMTPPPAPAIYATKVGEHRTVTLADGSRIDLNARTRLTVTLARGERQVVMDEGQAVFDVAHDARRPFLIAAGDRTVRVVGTQFDVRRRDGRLSVTVTRGLVEVAPNEHGAGQAFRLHPGQRLEHVEGAQQAQVSAAAPDQALGWRAGRMVYRDQPLSAVVADLNAQFAVPIRVSDAGLAATPISGVLIFDNEDAVVHRLALLVSAHAVRSDGGVTLQRNGTPGR